VDVITRLDAAGLLPAIVFVFSRVGCDAAVSQCVRSGLRLNSETEVEEIRQVIDTRTKDLNDADLRVLGYWEWREALERGFASHHAGLLPAFKETVEELFVRGLVKVVFATETLALGINMPARTVVLERLVKYNGEAHVELTPGEYTQLTGRAGRRGIDVEGHAVVIWQPSVDPRQVGGLASTRTYPLKSSFRPGYNMAVNLVARLGATQAREMLEKSFAQFQADRGVVGLARRIERNRDALEGYQESMTCHLGDFAEYAELRTKLNEREKALSRKNSVARRAEAARSLEALRKGDVIAVPSGRRAGLAIVVDPGLDPTGDARPLVITEDRWAGRLSVADFPTPVEALGRVKLPKQVDLRSPRSRRDLASTLRASGIEVPRNRRRGGSGAGDDAELAALRRALRNHPCHGCADREAHARWADRHRRLQAETQQLEQKVAAQTHSLARAFDRIRKLLTERGYLEGEDVERTAGVWTDEQRRELGHERVSSAGGKTPGTGPRTPSEARQSSRVTDAGRRLMRLYSESDLLAAECLRTGIWDRLPPPELAAVVSSLVYEARRDGPSEARVPVGLVSDALGETARLWASLEADERRHKLERTRQPDAGFAWTVYRWARGESLERVMTAAESAGSEFSAGDFVRWCRQVIDLLEQLRDVVGSDAPVGAAAKEAVKAMRRGVVALGTV
jgi:ATP-dependent RNA helicase HelY